MCHIIQTLQEPLLPPIHTQLTQLRLQAVQSLGPSPHLQQFRHTLFVRQEAVQIASLVAISQLPQWSLQTPLQLRAPASQRMCQTMLNTQHWIGATYLTLGLQNSSTSRCANWKTPSKCQLTQTGPSYSKEFPVRFILRSRISNLIFSSKGCMAVPLSWWFRDKVNRLQCSFI